jgi:hypothetical protein
VEGRVRVRVTFSAVRDGLVALLKERPGGRLKEALDSLAAKPDLSLSQLANTARDGKDGLVSAFGLLPAQAERLAQADDSVWMEVEELDLPATTTIELNVSPEGVAATWQELDALSTGQKATAVLLLLLLDSDAPLVVDQPEDDLDNRFITESIIPRMKEEKRRRQFIFATHNANIPVLGDAELIVGFSAKGESDGGQAALTSAVDGMKESDKRAVLRHPKADPEMLEQWGVREAHRLFRLEYPDHAANLTLDDWRGALEQWSRKPGVKTKPGPRTEKWNELADFVEKAGFGNKDGEPISGEWLRKQWAQWQRWRLFPAGFEGATLD